MKIWNKLTKPSKITFTVWSIYFLINLIVSYAQLKLYQWLIVWIFGVFLFVVIAQIISKLIYKLKSNNLNCTTDIQKQAILSSEFLKEEIAEPLQSHESQLPIYDAMEGHDFEYYCADLLKKDGYCNVEVTQGSGDQGIDILAEKNGIKFGIQCKCYSGNIGNSAVQQAFAGKTFYHCHIAAVLTNRYFTSSAKQLAEQNQVLLWDRDELKRLVRNAEN